jgi:lipoic acid synthetase
MKRPIPPAGKKHQVEGLLATGCLHTVCEEARCPNRGECYSRGTATFLIMGDVCTRNCRFCGVTSGAPGAVDPDEPRRVCDAVREMKLRYVVITSVTRDDLPDGGAGHFAAVVSLLKEEIPSVRVEILVPDFQGREESLRLVVNSSPDVFNHNIETVPRLYDRIRPAADYRRSLDVLASVHRMAPTLPVKSGLMVGLGEREDEVQEVMKDLRSSGCSIITIGQYLQPTRQQERVVEFVTPEQFERYTALGKELGFAQVFAGCFVRSSYRADELFDEKQNGEIQ